MDCTQYITVAAERKKGQHLGREERGAIQYLKRHGLSNRAIARELGCSPTTVGNELRRGTPPRKSNKGRPPGYSAKRGEAVYKANRVRSKRNHKIRSWGRPGVPETLEVRRSDLCRGLPVRGHCLAESLCTRYHSDSGVYAAGGGSAAATVASDTSNRGRSSWPCIECPGKESPRPAGTGYRNAPSGCTGRGTGHHRGPVPTAAFTYYRCFFPPLRLRWADGQRQDIYRGTAANVL